MCTSFRFSLTPIALLSAVIAGSSIGSAQQAAQAIPFAQAVKISVVSSKPAKIQGGDWDDKTQKIILRMKFVNTDVKQGYENYKATISVFGQSVIDSKVRKVLHQEQVPVTLTSGQVFEHACEEVTTQFDKTGAQFGFFYDGWIIVVKDASDKIVTVKSTSSSLEKLPEQADQLKVEAYYNAKLKSVKAPPAYRYR